MTIELATIADIDQILSIYRIARAFMKEHGNPTQWGDSKPSLETLQNDIEKHQLYLLKEDNKVHACFVFFIGIEPTYQKIEAGSWLSSSPYGVIHRVASDQSRHGVLTSIVSCCLTKISHLRIDTHQDNLVMQHQIKKNGFQYTGIIHLEDGESRLAYERL